MAPSYGRFCFWLMLVSLAGVIQAADAGGRVALVIGNSHYEPAVGPLRNTDNDAKTMAQALRGLGFSVTERHDMTRDQLLKVLDEFRRTLGGAEVALLYYAGHGISVAGSNYLIPLKAGFNPEGAADETTLRMLAETRLFNAEQAVADMSLAGAQCNIIILDACRTTLLARTSQTRGWNGNGGLTEMTPPKGSLIAFSTDAGRTALDGEGQNGLYTEELLKHLRTPGITIEQVFKRTRAGVLDRSEGKQMPAEYSRLVGADVYLASAIEERKTDDGEEKKEKLPDIESITKMAAAGKATECVSALQALAGERGPGDYAARPLEVLLDRVKVGLAGAKVSSPSVTEAEATCALVLRILPECLPLDHPLATPLFVRGHNRRGDALLLLGKPQEALQEYDKALSLAPEDAYIIYNRGRAHLALGNKDNAKEDFTTASGSQFNQPGARKLAQKALQELN